MTQDEKIARTRQLLSAPPRQLMYLPERVVIGCTETSPGLVDVECYPELRRYCIPIPKKRIQPEPNEIGYT
jgi:hypothetical protein